MPTNTITPNMSLIVPTIGQELSPTWATDINSSLSLIDSHDHTPGKGVQITPAALSISTDLSFQSHNATLLRSVRFDPQGSPLALGTDLGCLYESGVDLYYNDGSGNQIRLTQSGAISGTPGSIGGLVAPATATYTPFNQRFTFQSNVATSADISGGSFIIHENVASAKGITLSSPTSLPADYQLTFPSALPASQKIMSLDNLGNIAANYVVDNSTIEISSNTIRVKAGGINTAQLANDSVTTPIIANLQVTNAKLAAQNTNQAGNSSASNGTGTYLTISTITVTPSGHRNVLLTLNGGGASTISIQATAAGICQGFVGFENNGVQISEYAFQFQAAGAGNILALPASSFMNVNTLPSALSTVYDVRVKCGTNCASISSNNVSISATEL